MDASSIHCVAGSWRLSGERVIHTSLHAANNTLVVFDTIITSSDAALRHVM